MSSEIEGSEAYEEDLKNRISLADEMADVVIDELAYVRDCEDV